VGKSLIVTGYIPLPGHPRKATEYGELGEKIFKPLAKAGIPVLPFYETLDQCWLKKHIPQSVRPVTHSEGDNPAKNTLNYHIVNHQKFGWLVKALISRPEYDNFVWIDYGIGHVPGVDVDVVYDFMLRAAMRPDDFAIPGCWDKDNAMINDAWPCWRFCGGVMVVPREKVYPLYKGVKTAAKAHIGRTNNVTWEVNTLAEAEKSGAIPKVRWYKADHNETLFTNYAPDEVI
jgi:hypothetical protein